MRGSALAIVILRPALFAGRRTYALRVCTGTAGRVAQVLRRAKNVRLRMTSVVNDADTGTIYPFSASNRTRFPYTIP